MGTEIIKECKTCHFAKDFKELLKCHRTKVRRPVKYYDDWCKHHKIEA